MSWNFFFFHFFPWNAHRISFEKQWTFFDSDFSTIQMLSSDFSPKLWNMGEKKDIEQKLSAHQCKWTIAIFAIELILCVFFCRKRRRGKWRCLFKRIKITSAHIDMCCRVHFFASANIDFDICIYISWNWCSLANLFAYLSNTHYFLHSLHSLNIHSLWFVASAPNAYLFIAIFHGIFN